jgi:hypothetical protein
MATEMILVVFNASIEEEILDALRAAGMDCYTKIPGVHGAGSCSEPRLDSHVWPGTNTVYLIAVQAEEREPILNAVRKVKEVHREEGISAFILPLTGRV